MRITKSVEVDFACYLRDAVQTLDIVRLVFGGSRHWSSLDLTQLTDRGPEAGTGTTNGTAKPSVSGSTSAPRSDSWAGWRLN